MTTINTDVLVEAYIAVRTQRDLLLRDYEEKDQALKQDLLKLEAELLAVCNQVNVDSLKTKHGTATRKLSERFFCSDWDNFYNFVREHDAVQLLERRVHQGNFRQFMSEHENDGMPPGINVMREYGITVRRANTK